MGSINHSQAAKPDTAYLKKLIDSSLLADWAIRIEYQSNKSDTTSWQLWDKAHYAICSAQPVLEALLACYMQHPRSSIRINAEKFRPQSRMIYTVYNPQYLPADTVSNTQSYSGQSPREHTEIPAQIRLVNR